MWLEKKRSFLQSGKEFKLEDYSDDIYPLLLPIWHAMSPTEKRVVVNIVDRNEGHFTAKCLHELYFEAHVLYSDMQKLRLCVDAAKENPHHLDLGMPETESEGGYDSRVAPELVAAEAALPSVNEGLRSFQLKPRGLTGHALFEHMVQFRMRNSEQTQPSQ